MKIEMYSYYEIIKEDIQMAHIKIFKEKFTESCQNSEYQNSKKYRLTVKGSTL